jgi:hypothetical protein
VGNLVVLTPAIFHLIGYNSYVGGINICCLLGLFRNTILFLSVMNFTDLRNVKNSFNIDMADCPRRLYCIQSL